MFKYKAKATQSKYGIFMYAADGRILQNDINIEIINIRSKIITAAAAHKILNLKNIILHIKLTKS